jgi:hypothetical protein
MAHEWVLVRFTGGYGYRSRAGMGNGHGRVRFGEPGAKESLTPKGPRGVFLHKRSKSAISSSKSSNEIFFTFLHFQL